MSLSQCSCITKVGFKVRKCFIHTSIRNDNPLLMTPIMTRVSLRYSYQGLMDECHVSISPDLSDLSISTDWRKKHPRTMYL